MCFYLSVYEESTFCLQEEFISINATRSYTVVHLAV